MSSTRFRKREEALGPAMRDMETAKYVAGDAGAPHSPKGSQVECCGQYGPLGRHVCQTSQEEPVARLLLLDNPEHRLDYLLPQLCMPLCPPRWPSKRGGAAAPRRTAQRLRCGVLLHGLDGRLSLQHEGRIIAAQKAPSSPGSLRNGIKASSGDAIRSPDPGRPQ